ncbi:hypothetical protein Ntsu_70750 [Nocardia sp. IFM 10818]
MIRIQRHVRAARLEDGVHADQQFDRSPNGQAHQHIRAHTRGRQPARQPIRPGVQLGIGQALVTELHRHRVRGAAHLLLEQRGQRLHRRQPRGQHPGRRPDGIVEQFRQHPRQRALLPLHERGQRTRHHHLNERLGFQRTAHGLGQHLQLRGERRVAHGGVRVPHRNALRFQRRHRFDQERQIRDSIRAA